MRACLYIRFPIEDVHIFTKQKRRKDRIDFLLEDTEKTPAGAKRCVNVRK